MENPGRPRMQPLMRAAHFGIGLALLLWSFWVFGSVVSASFYYYGTPEDIQHFDLRPFSFGDSNMQVWLARVVTWGWPVVGAIGLVILIVGLMRRSVGRFRTAGLVASLVVALALYGLTARTYLRSPGSSVSIASLAGLGRHLHTSFPAGTRLVEARVQFGMGRRTVAVLTMPREAVIPFAKKRMLDIAIAPGASNLS